MNAKILICTHKEVELPVHEYFFPIQAGAEISEKKLSYNLDNIGDNISLKNKNYCELTAHYWAWKNLKDVDIVGLNHYRRYFDFFRTHKLLSPDRNFIGLEEFLAHPYQFPDLGKVLQEYDIILPDRRNHPYNLKTQYSVFHITEDWNILKEVIQDLYPDYIPSFEKFEKGNSLSNYNMFITSWGQFDRYSTWLFQILFEVEKRIKISAYANQARVFGYMSERLINIFCDYNHLNVLHFPVIMPLEGYKGEAEVSNWRYQLRWLKNNICFLLDRDK